jgi:hypothetical protein
MHVLQRQCSQSPCNSCPRFRETNVKAKPGKKQTSGRAVLLARCERHACGTWGEVFEPKIITKQGLNLRSMAEKKNRDNDSPKNDVMCLRYRTNRGKAIEATRLYILPYLLA